MIEIELVIDYPLERMVKATPFYGKMERRPHAKTIIEGDTILVPLGPREIATPALLEEAGAALFLASEEWSDDALLLDLRTFGLEALDLIAGILLSSFKFEIYKSEKKHRLKKIQILVLQENEWKQTLAQLIATYSGVEYARVLTSEPPNVFYPLAYANRLKELESLGITVEILNKENLQAINMNALLAVGQGSLHAPCVAILTWKGAEGSPVVLVGKGVCFDSGGVCLKSAAEQVDMKWDKAGAGAVAGVIKALAQMKAPCHVVGVLGLVENMPDGGALRTGDVIRTFEGHTVEIGNTDAEGRLVLADCLAYARKCFSPLALIDLGTLTIETFASLGHVFAGLYSNDRALAKSMKEAGLRSRDHVWELPMGPFFAEQIESSIADMKNVGVDLGGENGAAAEFLLRYVGDTPWIHLDISGVAWLPKEKPLAPTRVTGFGVRLLVDWLLNRLLA